MPGSLAGSLGGQQTGQAPASPLSVLGSDLAAHLRIEDWTAASWPDVTGNLTLAQNSAGSQFTAVNALNGQRAARADGSDDYMVGDMSTPLASGSRPWIVMLFRLQSDPGSGSKTIFGLTSVAAGFGLVSFALASVSSVRKLRLTMTKAGPATYTIPGPAVAGLPPFVWEMSWPNATTGKHVVDGVPYDTVTSGSADTAGLVDAAGRIELANNSAMTVGCNALYRDLIISSAIPTAAQRAAIYRYLQYRLAGV